MRRSRAACGEPSGSNGIHSPSRSPLLPATECIARHHQLRCIAMQQACCVHWLNVAARVRRVMSRLAQSAVSVTLTIPASLRTGQQLPVRFRDGTVRRVSVPAGIRPGRQLRVRMYQPGGAVGAGGAAAVDRPQGASILSQAMPPHVAVRFEVSNFTHAR